MIGSIILAAAAPIALRVGYVDNKFPCSYKDHEAWRGSAVEAWAHVAERTAVPFTVQSLKTPREALEALDQNKIDIAVSCFNLTEQRLERFGYTSPYRFDGIKLIGKSNNQDMFSSTLETIQNSKLAEAFLILFGSTLIITLLVISFDRSVIRSALKSENMETKSFIRLWLWLTMGGSLLDKSPKLKIAAIGAFSHYARIIFTSALIAAITAISVRNSQSSDGLFEIRTISDLKDLRVGVIEGSYAEDVITNTLKLVNTNSPAKISAQKSLEELGELLAKDKIDIIAGDATAIEIYSETLNDHQNIHLYPTEFAKTPQGFLTSRMLAERIDNSIDAAVVSMMASNNLDIDSEIPEASNTTKKDKK